MKPILYQWPPALGTESIYPRCVVFQRIFNIARQEFKISNVKVPKPGPNFHKELQSRLIGLPVLEADGARYNTSAQIIDFIIRHDPAREVKAKLVRLTSAHSFIMQQWGNECFINSLVYARWMKDENFGRFVKNVNWGEPYEVVQEEVGLLRADILKYLKRTTAGNMPADQYAEMLRNQLWSLNHILSAHDFLEPMVPYPTLTDLNVFMVVQGLLSPDLEESQWIKDHYEHVVRWAKTVDEITAKPG